MVDILRNKEELEKWKKYRGSLKHLAFKNEDSLGRITWNPDDDRDLRTPVNVDRAINDPFELDSWKITNSKMFRMLSGKAQVFHNPINPLVRNRGHHTQRVMSISFAVSSYLGLNEKLPKAGAGGHDAGHTMYGHLGEKYLRKIVNDSGIVEKFTHAKNSVFMLESIERKGKGLNLTREVKEIIQDHSAGDDPIVALPGRMQEKAVVQFSDRVGYTGDDISDIGRYLNKDGKPYIDSNNLPKCFIDFLEIAKIPKKQYTLGNIGNIIIDSCIESAIEESSEKGYFSFNDSDIAKKFEEIRNWLHENVYYKIDKSEFTKILDMICSYLTPLYPDVPIWILMPLLIDWDATRILEKIQFSNTYMGSMGFDEIIRNFPKEKMKEIKFLSYDMNPNHYSKPSL